MLTAWRATQSDQEILCESLIKCFKGTPNEQGQSATKEEFKALVGSLERLCTNQGNFHNLIVFLVSHLVNITELYALSISIQLFNKYSRCRGSSPRGSKETNNCRRSLGT